MTSVRNNVSAAVKGKLDPKQIQKALAQLKKNAQQTSRFRKTLTTAATNVATAIYTSPVIPSSTRIKAQAHVFGTSPDGTEYLCAGFVTAFYCDPGGTLLTYGTSALFTAIASSSQAAAFTASADNTFSLTVDDDGNTMVWSAWIELFADWGDAV